VTRYRNGLIYTALFLTFGSCWIAFCIWRLLAWWLITLGSLGVAAIAQTGELLITWHLDRHRRSRRRAHARTRPKTRKAA
jgi:hypothetical protein